MKKNQHIEDGGIDLDIHQDVAQGIYSNFVLVSQSPIEFVFDFVQAVPGIKKATVRSRVVMNPLVAKRMHQVLSENLEMHQREYGKIKDMEQSMVVPSTGATA